MVLWYHNDLFLGNFPWGILWNLSAALNGQRSQNLVRSAMNILTWFRNHEILSSWIRLKLCLVVRFMRVWVFRSMMALIDDYKRLTFKKSWSSCLLWGFLPFRISVHWKESKVRNRQSRSPQNPSDGFLGTRSRNFFMISTHNKLSFSRDSCQCR
jgi:hypothetical protein